MISYRLFIVSKIQKRLTNLLNESVLQIFRLISLPRHHIERGGFSNPLFLFYLGVITLILRQLRFFILLVSFVCF